MILPQLNELLSPLGQVLAVSGDTSESAAFCWDNSALTLPGVGWYQVMHPGPASPPFPALRLLSGGHPAALPPIPAAAGRHLGLHLACESTRVALKMSAPQLMGDGSSELSSC